MVRMPTARVLLGLPSARCGVHFVFALLYLPCCVFCLSFFFASPAYSGGGRGWEALVEAAGHNLNSLSLLILMMYVNRDTIIWNGVQMEVGYLYVVMYL